MKLHQFTSYAQAGALITNNNGEQINLISIDINGNCTYTIDDKEYTSYYKELVLNLRTIHYLCDPKISSFFGALYMSNHVNQMKNVEVDDSGLPIIYARIVNKGGLKLRVDFGRNRKKIIQKPINKLYTLQHNLCLFLIKYHIDIYNLIDQGLAVEKTN